MEYVPGRTLKDIETDERVLPLGHGLAIAKKICRGLAAAHRIGVLHRDLKPENVIVTDGGTPQAHGLRDRRRDRRLARRGEEDTVPGTPQFLAPELLRGEAPSVLTDVYAMGVVLLRDVHGTGPVRRPGHVAGSSARSSRRRPRQAASFRPDLPPELLSILDRAIAKDPQARFSDSDALADAIAAFEGSVLDRVLAEVSVTRAKMVKLMVILEANKSLAATFDPTEILRIILRTATSETDAERGTIFLREPGSETSSSARSSRGARSRRSGSRSAAASRERSRRQARSSTSPTPTATGGSTSDTDASSGFRTSTILAAPMRTPAGEIVGVVELLNKRHRPFTKEDEEFLAEVGTHSALAVAGRARARGGGGPRAAGGRRGRAPGRPGTACAGRVAVRARFRGGPAALGLGRRRPRRLCRGDLRRRSLSSSPGGSRRSGRLRCPARRRPRRWTRYPRVGLSQRSPRKGPRGGSLLFRDGCSMARLAPPALSLSCASPVSPARRQGRAPGRPGRNESDDRGMRDQTRRSRHRGVERSGASALRPGVSASRATRRGAGVRGGRPAPSRLRADRRCVEGRRRVSRPGRSSAAGRPPINVRSKV